MGTIKILNICSFQYPVHFSMKSQRWCKVFMSDKSESQIFFLDFFDEKFFKRFMLTQY